MGKGPQAPDPWATARATSAAESFAANQNVWNQNFNEVNPYGTKNIAQTGTVQVYDPFSRKMIDQPQYTQTVSLSPAEQAILDKNTAMRSNIGDIGVQQTDMLGRHLAPGLQLGNMQAWNAGPQAGKLATSFGGDNPTQMSIASQNIRQDQTPTDRGAVEQAMMERYSRQADPRNQAQEAQMAARGLNPGGQGYAEMQDAQGRERTEMQTNAFLASGQESRASQDAYNQASMQRFGQGAAQGAFANSAQQQAYMQAMQRAGFSNEAILQMFAMGGQEADRGNALRQSQFQEELAKYHDPINVAMAMLQGTQVSTPQFQPYQGSSVNAAPIGQYIYDKYNADKQDYQNKMSGIAGIGSAVAGALPWASWLS